MSSNQRRIRWMATVSGLLFQHAQPRWRCCLPWGDTSLSRLQPFPRLWSGCLDVATDVCSVPGADAPIIDVNSASRTNFDEVDKPLCKPCCESNPRSQMILAKSIRETKGGAACCPIWYLFIISCTDTLVWIRSERSEREAGRFYFKLSANRCGPAATIYEAVPRADSIWGVGTLNYEGYELIELLLQVFPSACGALHQSNVNDRHDSLWGYLQDNPSPGKLFYLSWHTLTRCNAQYCPGPSICITVCNNNTSKEPERGNQLIDTADITFAKDGCWNYEHLSFKGMQTCCVHLYF